MHPRGTRPAWLACGVGVLFCAVSVYWGLGGTWLVATVRASLAKHGEDGPSLLLFAWIPAIAKLIAAVLPLLVLRPWRMSARGRAMRALVWLEATILITYGVVLTGAGLLVQADVLHASAAADHRALAWHAYLWDPWFLLWGLLVAAALLRSRDRRGADAPPPVVGAPA